MSFQCLISLSLLTALGLSLPLNTWAEEAKVASSTTHSQETPALSAPMIAVTLKQVFKDTLPGDQPRSPLILRDKLEQYTITLQNTQPNPVQILSSEITNRIPPEQAYHQVQESTGKAYASMVGAGLLLAPMTFGGSLVAEALIGGPIVVCLVNSRNKKLLKYVNQYPSNIPLVTLLPGESKSFTVFTEPAVKPEVHLSAQDLKTQVVFTLP